MKVRRIPMHDSVTELRNYSTISNSILEKLGLPELVSKKARPKAAHAIRLIEATLLSQRKESIPINTAKTIVSVFWKELPYFRERNALSAPDEASFQRMQKMLEEYLKEMKQWGPNFPMAFPREFLERAVQVHMNEFKILLGDKYDSFFRLLNALESHR